MSKINPNFDFSFMEKNLSLLSIKEKNEQPSNELKNPYLKKDDIPELEFLGKNNIIICDKKKYEIKDYIEEINNDSNDILDDEIYNYCGNCKKKTNKFFCFICIKNICDECYKECNFNEHSTKNLDDIIDKNNINEIKKILNNLIIPIDKDEKIIKNIIEYIDKCIINNDINNPINKDFSITNFNEKSEDILLIYQIISKDYNNYFHYKNIEKILVYLIKEYNTDLNCKYEGIGKFIFENGGYYIGEFKNGLINGKGILNL